MQHSSTSVSEESIWLTGVLFTVVLCLILLSLTYKKLVKWRKFPNLPNGPWPLPLIGDAKHLDGHEVQFNGLTNLREKYGDIYSFKMGSLDCVVLNRYEDIQEAFSSGRDDLDGRPDFKRFTDLFGGKKENGLAFCDYSSMQEQRRRLLRPHTLPYSGAPATLRLEQFVAEECASVVEDFSKRIDGDVFGVELDIKMTLLKACSNIFNRYFCDGNKRFDYTNKSFSDFVSSFDEVFYEVNQSRVCDIMPWMYFTAWHKVRGVKHFAGKVRTFVVSEFIDPYLSRTENSTPDDEPETLLSQLAPHMRDRADNDDTHGHGLLAKNTALYALEDILGGSCAVGCITLRMLRDLAKHPEIQTKIYEELNEIDSQGGVDPAYTMSKSSKLHWTRAAAAETIRLTCSPIVPHRATRDTKINGYDVPKDTVILANNHALNMTGPNWGSNPELFNPTHHLDKEQHYQKPHNHFPFSFGKRSCLGFRMVENISVALVAALVQSFEMSLTETVAAAKIPRGMLAVPLAPFKVVLRPRC